VCTREIHFLFVLDVIHSIMGYCTHSFYMKLQYGDTAKMSEMAVYS
jgi:hypothetical protein